MHTLLRFGGKDHPNTYAAVSVAHFQHVASQFHTDNRELEGKTLEEKRFGREDHHRCLLQYSSRWLDYGYVRSNLW